MKTKKIILTMALLSSLYANAAHKGGNGDYCSQGPEGTCKRVNFSLDNVHPMQSEILSMLEKKNLPRYIRNQILSDLKDTLVLYSDERISYEELIPRYEMQTSSVKTTKNYDSNGVLTGSTEEEFKEKVAVLEDLGIYINASIGYKTDDKKRKDLYVRSITERFPSPRVIYFRHFLEQIKNDKRKIITMIFHEQAHRIPFLRPLMTMRGQEDERVAEGWGDLFYRYLNGEFDYRAFSEKLDTFGITLENDLNFPNPVRVKGANYYSDITTSVSAKDIVEDFSNNKDYLVEFDKNIFTDYPTLKTSNQIIRIPLNKMENIDNIDLYFAKLKTSTEPVLVTFRFYYIESLNDYKQTMKSGTLSKNQEIYDIALGTPEIDQFAQSLVDKLRNNNIMATRDTNFLIGDNLNWYFSQNAVGLKKNLSSFVNMFTHTLNEKIVTNPIVTSYLFEKFLNPGKFNFKFEAAQNRSEQKSSSDKKEMKQSIPILLLTLSADATQEDLEILSTELVNSLLILYTQEAKGAHLKSEILKIENKYLPLLGNGISSELQSIEDLPYLEKLYSNKKYQSFLYCMTSKIRDFDSAYSFITKIFPSQSSNNSSAQSIYWDWLSGGSWNTTILSFPSELLEQDIDPIASSIANNVFSGENFQNGQINFSSSYSFQSPHYADWNKRRKKFVLGKPSANWTELPGGYSRIPEIMKSCNL